MLPLLRWVRAQMDTLNSGSVQSRMGQFVHNLTQTGGSSHRNLLFQGHKKTWKRLPGFYTIPMEGSGFQFLLA